jgi:hypothetical protein
MKKMFLLWMLILLTACNTTKPEIVDSELPDPSVIQEETVEDEIIPESTDIPEDTLGVVSFTPETYRMEEIGFELRYPQEWMLDEMDFGSRASGATLTSWQHPAGQIDQVPESESVLSLTVYQWDPKNDLDAYVQTRMRDAWTASGIQILDEEDLELESGQRAVRFTIRNDSDGAEAFFLVTLAGDQYLVLSGSGDLELLKEIALTGKFAN